MSRSITARAHQRARLHLLTLIALTVLDTETVAAS